MTLAAGTRLGPYEVIAPLDAGGMGEVYRARDPRIGREVAVKVLPPSFSQDRDRLRRFEQEARAAGALNHPALMTIHDIGQQDGAPYIVSELLEGETLRTRLRGGALSAGRAIDYAIQLARGLAAAHEGGIVHRDIKPENIFITKDGRVKLLDFGLAKVDVATASDKTSPRAVMGTAGYMSPEQVRGEEVDQRSDIFSFGTVLYECLTGRTPFHRLSAVETMNAVLKEDPAEDARMRSGVERVVRRCLEKHREARFQSAADLAFHLENLSDISGSHPVAVVEAARNALALLTANPQGDVFSIGTALYEMIAGVPFAGEERSANLTGSEAIAAINRIVHRATATNPEDRYPSPAAMAKDLRAAMSMPDIASPVAAQRVARLVVLPFKILRPDAETDFLALALPVAITASLTGLHSLVMRSPSAARAFEGDFAKLKSEIDVDLAMLGTMMRAGDRLRVTTELVEVPSGTVVWSGTSQVSPADVFQLQDELTRHIVSSLQFRLTDREQRLLRGDVPESAAAHEFYLRAGQLPQSTQDWLIARDLYRRSVEEDPHYAPAWARLARIELLLGKYAGQSKERYAAAESALQKALDINSELPIAHHVYALLEVQTGRAQDAVIRLLDLVAHGTNDVEIFAGLVLACRYSGLLHASVAAHEQARRLDPNASTSAAHTYWMLGQYERALEAVDHNRDPGGEAALIYALAGDMERALELLDDRERRLRGDGARESVLGQEIVSIRAVLNADAGTAFPILDRFRDFPDPEGLYYVGRAFARLGDSANALEVLNRAERTGFFCFGAYAGDPWLDGVRGQEGFMEILRRAEERTREAERRFAERPASRILTVGLRS